MEGILTIDLLVCHKKLLREGLKNKNTTNLGFSLKLGGEGSEGVPGTQPVNGHYLNVPP